jgi:hypothetical protein
LQADKLKADILYSLNCSGKTEIIREIVNILRKRVREKLTNLTNNKIVALIKIDHV